MWLASAAVECEEGWWGMGPGPKLHPLALAHSPSQIMKVWA